MSSRKCRFGCTPPYDQIGRPCPECRANHERDMDVSYAEYILEKQCKELDKILPATDAEWRAHCDEVAPLEPVASLSLDFRSKPGIDSLPSFWETD